MRLFVDIDDTLIIYYDTGDDEEAHPYGAIHGESYHINQTLKNFIFAFREKYEDALIVIWSGGGDQYAAQVAEEAGLGEVNAMYLTKDRETFYLVREGDIVVDDQPIKVAATVTPPDFFDSKDNWGL